MLIIIRFKSYHTHPRETKVRAHNNIMANDLLIKHFLNVPHMIHILMKSVLVHFGSETSFVLRIRDELK